MSHTKTIYFCLMMGLRAAFGKIQYQREVNGIGRFQPPSDPASGSHTNEGVIEKQVSAPSRLSGNEFMEADGLSFG
jgi:hypothetical protein